MCWAYSRLLGDQGHTCEVHACGTGANLSYPIYLLIGGVYNVALSVWHIGFPEGGAVLVDGHFAPAGYKAWSGSWGAWMESLASAWNSMEYARYWSAFAAGRQGAWAASGSRSDGVLR